MAVEYCPQGWPPTVPLIAVSNIPFKTWSLGGPGGQAQSVELGTLDLRAVICLLNNNNNNKNQTWGSISLSHPLNSELAL